LILGFRINSGRLGFQLFNRIDVFRFGQLTLLVKDLPGTWGTGDKGLD